MNCVVHSRSEAGDSATYLLLTEDSRKSEGRRICMGIRELGTVNECFV